MAHFPVTESTLSATQLGVFIQQAYGLSSLTICELFRTGMNHLYMVTDGSQKFVWRVYTHQWRTKSEIAEEIRLLSHLRANSISVSYPIADVRGEFIHDLDAPEGLRYGVMFSFAEGNKNPRFTPETSYHIGVAMAKMHQAVIGFQVNRITYNPQVLLIDSFQRTKSFFSRPSEEMTFVESLTNFLNAEYQKVKTEDVRNGTIHLDVWFDNMHFRNNDEVTFFDFDFCGNGWLCHDISYFLFQLFSTNPTESDYTQKMEKFLKGYESITPITAEEKRIIPITSLAIFLFYLSMQVDRYDTWSNIFLNEDHLKRFVGMLKKWTAFHQLPVV